MPQPRAEIASHRLWATNVISDDEQLPVDEGDPKGSYDTGMTPQFHPDGGFFREKITGDIARAVYYLQALESTPKLSPVIERAYTTPIPPRWMARTS